MLNIIPKTGLAEFIKDLAKQHNVVYVKTSNDRLAEVITRLSDDEVVFDDVENLIVALKRAGIIDSKEMAKLLIAYLNERKNLRGF